MRRFVLILALLIVAATEVYSTYNTPTAYTTVLWRTTNQSISASTSTSISWDTAVRNGGCWSSLAPTLLTAPKTGKYLIVARVFWAAPSVASGNQWVTLKKNNSLWAWGARVISCKSTSDTTGGACQSISWVVDASGGDYFEVSVFQTTPDNPQSVLGSSIVEKTSVAMTLMLGQ